FGPELRLEGVHGGHYCSIVSSGDAPSSLEEEVPGRVRGPAPAWLRAGRPALHRLTRNRRQALMALGGGAAVLGGLGAGAAMAFGEPGDGGGDGLTPRDAGAFSDRDASYVSA